MYQDFYQLERAPFNTTPDPAFFYASPVHQEALAAIAYGVENRKGFISLIGEVGTGKTTVLRTYIGSSELENTRIIYLFNPNVTFDDLLVMVLRELEIEHEIPRDQTRRIDLLHRVLVREYKRGNNVVLIIDEAQNVPPETLESIRLLTNIETDSEKLIQIILCGQPELKRLLAMQSLRQLRERIAVKTELRTLTKAEAIEYIHHRLNRARQPQDGGAGVGRVSRSGGGSNNAGGNIFTDDAINEVIRRTGGNPRAINILCDNALITGYGYQKYPIASPIIREIAKELDDGLPPKAGFASDGDRSGWARVAGYGLAAVAVIGLIALGGLMLFKALFDRMDDQQPVADQNVNQTQQIQQDQQVQRVQQDQQVQQVQQDDAGAVTNPQTTAEPAVEMADSSTNMGAADAINMEDSNTGAIVTDSSTASTSSGVVTFDQNANTGADTAAGVESSVSDALQSVGESAPQAEQILTEGMQQTDTQLQAAQDSAAAVANDVTSQITPASVNDQQSQVVRSVAPEQQTTAESPQDPAKVNSTNSIGVITTSSESQSVVSNNDTQQTVVVSDNAISDSQVAVANDNSSSGQQEIFAVRTVNSGDMLWNMVLDVYGVASPQIMEWLLDQNPQIANRDVINVGEDINFPNLPERFLP